jgi:hypothetical protein
MAAHHRVGLGAAEPRPQSPFARVVRRVVLPAAALCVVAGLAAGCGAASTPLERYQNCITCGYDFSYPIPTAAAAMHRRDG